ncbi:MAG: hypothetical protein K0Q94_2871 [Paenibacillus sp.]|jgi:hypothetical protein|nr:hypothetical protein [Paenibacillus sp.]
MKIKKFASMAAISCVLAVSVVMSSASADTLSDPKSIKFREEAGFSVSPAALEQGKKESGNNKSKRLYGVELTEAEAQELFDRQRVPSEIGNKHKQMDSFAGQYIDTKTGNLHIGFTNDDPSIQAQILSPLSEKDKKRVKFFTAKYTKKELEDREIPLKDFMKSVSPEEFKAFGLVSSGFDPEHNKFRVVVSEKTPGEKIQKIKEIIGEDYVLIEVDGEPYQPMARTDKFRPVIAGVKI